MNRSEILDAVKRTITQDRNNRHGEPENSFPRIAEAWTDYLNRTRDALVNLKPSDIAEMMAIFKTCRFEMQPDNPDNEHDRIGYYAIAAELRAAERAVWGTISNPTARAEKTIAPSILPRVYGVEVRTILGMHDPFPDYPEGTKIARQTGQNGFEFYRRISAGWVPYEPHSRQADEPHSRQADEPHSRQADEP